MEHRAPCLGEKMPELAVTTSHGRLNLPDDYAGKWFVLFTQPADYPAVGITEFVALQRRSANFKELGCELLGLAMGQTTADLKWVKDNLGIEIEFPIIAEAGQLAARLGLVHPGPGPCTLRAVFIVDPQARLQTMLYYPQEIGRNIDEALRVLKALQIARDKGVTCPAGWPNNELIGSRVLLKPAPDQATAEKQARQAVCLDWWFCHQGG
jgi:peroxiredoxin (alkyl hydroperoxide reductase subunit C)